MRKYDVAYVPNGPVNYYPSKELEDMTLDEIVKKYIKTCAKANGKVSTCSKCKVPCKEGKRAIQLVANQIYDNPPIPLYGGKTLIERAKEENMKRKQNEAVQVTKENFNELKDALEKAKEEALGKPVEEEKNKPTKEETKRKYLKVDGWWEASLASGDQTKWLMENLNLSRTQAKKRIYSYRYVHGMTGEKKEERPAEVKVEKKEEVKEEKKVEEPVKSIDASIESKLEKLMKQQEQCQKEIDTYQKLLDEAKAKYEEVKKKADILCSAMDILNDT